MQQETILYDPSGNRFCLLNTTAAFLWERLTTPATIEELSDALCAHFHGVDKAAAERDVKKALDEFQALAVVETDA